MVWDIDAGCRRRRPAIIAMDALRLLAA